MTTSTRMISPAILQQAKVMLEQHFLVKVEILSSHFLTESDRRNNVLRLMLKGESNIIPKSLILKQSLPETKDADDEDTYARFARDWAGLEFASKINLSFHNVPRFFGGNQEFRFILIEDLGHQHISLVDSLTLPNSDKAFLALSRFMRALGNFHAGSFGQTALYETILKTIHQDAKTIEYDLNFTLKDLIAKLKTTSQKLNLSLTTECLNEVNSLINSLLKPGFFTVLTHGDICPDNVFDHADGRDLQLIDFEWAFVRNALLDGTYLRMSMPTCWCAKAIPENMIAPLESLYREELKRTIPAASDDLAYNTAYTEACGFWLLQQTLPFIDSILEKDRIDPSGPVPEHSLWRPEENSVRPRVISRLKAFIHVASTNHLLPHLRQIAEKILNEVKKLWPNAPDLDVYPAFKDLK